MFNELIKAFLFIFMAEMGDKTQILAMAFSTQFKVRKVLLGVMIGSALNHGLAVILGYYLSNLIKVNLIQLLAACCFIFFGLWTLRDEDEEEEEKGKQSNLGPILTVAVAFFLGEMGDKTQLTALTLATDSPFPVFILMGTVLGMVAVSSLGIFLGVKLGKLAPKFLIKLIAASIFLVVGVVKLYQTVPAQYLTGRNILIFVLIITVVIYHLLKPFWRRMEGFLAHKAYKN